MTVEFGSGDPAAAEVLTRCGRTIRRLVDGGGDDADLDSALADLFGLPDELRPSPLAGALVMVLLRLGLRAEPRHVQHIDALLAIADRDPPPWREWADIKTAARLLAASGRVTALGAGDWAEPPDLNILLAELEKLAGLPLPAEVSAKMSPLFQLLRTALTALHDAMHDDETALRRLPADLERIHGLIDDPELSAEFTPMIEVMSRSPDLLLSDRRENLPAQEATELLQGAIDAVPPHRRNDDFPDFVKHIESTMTRLRLLPRLGAPDGPGTAPTSEQVAALRARAEHPDASAAERASAYGDLGMAELWRGPRETDLGRIDRAIGYFRQALAAAATAAPVSTAGSWSGHPTRVIGLLSLATVLALRWTVAGQRDNLVEAEQLLAEAQELAGGPASAFWGKINETLSSVRAILGANSGAQQAGLDSLRRYAWKVLLQSDPAAATAAALGAVSDATRVARRFLAAGQPADAIQALDAGRALVLFAATELRDVATRLDAAGRGDLAERWRRATASGGPDTVPVELRREALAALSGPAGPPATGAAGPLDPPSLPEIRSALAALDADALVYLVPATSSDTGYAVIAPAQGPPASMELPGLALDDQSDLGRYLNALSNRDAALVSAGPFPAGGSVSEPRAGAGPANAGHLRDVALQRAESRFVDTLDALCDWAWGAAIGPLLEQYLARRPAAESARPPRLVLVPMGSLARVPWQAARRPDGTYAVQLAAFSQAASARMLCASAARTPVPLAPVGLVVGDPDTTYASAELTAARVEAYAIHQSFYRGGRYLGRRPDGRPSRSGAGTAAQIRDWLTSIRPGAGAMLHLACHGVVEVNETTSYLLLAGRERLTAEELIGVLAEAPQRALGLVVLAACRTGVSSRGYDEAYSLGTAFLAGGARSVLSTQWSIPDRATSVLMFMFHHFLMTERRPAWDALRRSQLWMLDPDRRPPAGMSPQLRRQLWQTDPAQIVAWAGFVHWGR